MGIAKGVSLGPYEILSLIGEGGMGEVWRARDRRIGRDVAVKVLPESFTHGDERLWRFEQEARAAGALNHPGLVTIYDVGTTDGAPYIVMELLEGKTLRDAIDDLAPNPIPLRKVIGYATQIASALAVAHEKGIIHRDLKPENLFVTAEGHVKILDFGLAKLAGETTETDGRRKTARHLTSAGVAVGTPGYMSPEQVRAQPIDHRTDLFSLGVVIYEMLTGRPAFDGSSAVETMHAVLSDDPPPLTAIVPDVPPALDAMVSHCLEKNPRDRFQSARDLAFQLRTLQDAQSGAVDARKSAHQPRARRLPYRAALAVLALLLAGGAIGWALFHARRGGVQTAPRTFRQLTFRDGLETFPTLAPDGKTLAYVSSESGNRDIYVQRVDGRVAANVTSDSRDDDSEPVFSPDGAQIAFRSERGGGGIFVMGVTGESVRRLTDFGHNPSWSPDGKRIAVSTAGVELRPHLRADNGELWVVDAASGAKRPIVQPRIGGPDFARDSDAVQPSWSPHGKRIAFWGVSSAAGQRDIWTIDPDAPQPKKSVVRVTSGPAIHWNPVWSPDGRYLYFGSDRDGTLNLWRVAMDEESGAASGAAEPLSLPASVSGNFAVSQQGELAFTTVTRSYQLLALPFEAGHGPPRPLFGGSQEILTFEPSPDGQAIAFTTGGAQEDLFVANIDGTRPRQLTNDAARDRGVTWSHDGKTLYFYSNRDSAYHLWSIQADGGGLTRITDPADLQRIGARNVYSPNLSPDGRTLAAETDHDGVLVHLDRPIAHRLETFGAMNAPKWAPDGQHLAGTLSDGSIGLYSLQTRRLEKLAGRGLAPQWLPDGKRIAIFGRSSIGFIDLASRNVSTIPVTTPPGAELDNLAVWPRLSRDGATLYVRQTQEQGDIWMVGLGSVVSTSSCPVFLASEVSGRVDDRDQRS